MASSLLFNSGLYFPIQQLLANLKGGFILAFHNLAPKTFESLITALLPNKPIPLEALVEKIKYGRCTKGDFSITVDDGVGMTVRMLSESALKHRWPVTFYLPTCYIDHPSEPMIFQWLGALDKLSLEGRFHLSTGEVDWSTPESKKKWMKSITHIMYTEKSEKYENIIRELAHILITAGHVRENVLDLPEAISWEEVESLSRHDILSFESHSVSHRAMIALNEDELRQELVLSRQAIEERTKKPCRHFCYPFGGDESIGPQAVKQVAAVYESAVTMIRGRIRGSSLYFMPRIPFYEGDNPAIARLKIMI